MYQHRTDLQIALTAITLSTSNFTREHLIPLQNEQQALLVMKQRDVT